MLLFTSRTGFLETPRESTGPRHPPDRVHGTAALGSRGPDRVPRHHGDCRGPGDAGGTPRAAVLAPVPRHLHPPGRRATEPVGAVARRRRVRRRPRRGLRVLRGRTARRLVRAGRCACRGDRPGRRAARAPGPARAPGRPGPRRGRPTLRSGRHDGPAHCVRPGAPPRTRRSGRGRRRSRRTRPRRPFPTGPRAVSRGAVPGGAGHWLDLSTSPTLVPDPRWRPG